VILGDDAWRLHRLVATVDFHGNRLDLLDSA